MLTVVEKPTRLRVVLVLQLRLAHLGALGSPNVWCWQLRRCDFSQFEAAALPAIASNCRRIVGYTRRTPNTRPAPNGT